MRIIALLSDFGLMDPYVGQMKAAILRGAPQASLVDVSHEVAPFNIIQAGFFLAASLLHFPEGTIFVAVVDPGVGGDRRLVLLEMAQRLVLAPDNGLLSLVLATPAGEQARGWDVTSALTSVSATFHGRDVFAPLAARLATGEAPASLGPALRLATLVRSDWAAPRQAGADVVGSVIHRDRFGNCILNLVSDQWQPLFASEVRVRLIQPQEAVVRPVRTYADLPPGGLGILPGSQGYLELAVNRGNAAERLGLRIGTMIRLRTDPA